MNLHWLKFFGAGERTDGHTDIIGRSPHGPKTFERSNICYIFEKLEVQGCQILYSHVSIPFTVAPALDTQPIQLVYKMPKRSLYVIISGKIPEN